MIKFSTLVRDEVGIEFKQFCNARGQSAYKVLSDLIHKLVNATPPTENRTEARLLAIRRKQKALQGDGTGDKTNTCKRCGRPYGDCSHTSTD